MTTIHEPSVKHQMKQALDERRPDRYTPKDTRQLCPCGTPITWALALWNDFHGLHRCAFVGQLEQPTSAWLDNLADEFKDAIPAGTAQVRAARQMIGTLEGARTRATLQIVRRCLLQPTLDWIFFRSLPLVVGPERVAIRATSQGDWRQFAEEETVRAAADNRARLQTIEGAIWLADHMQVNGLRTGAEIHW